MSREIFLLAGEASGDSRGAELIRALRIQDASLTFAGMGGPLMKQEGMEVVADVHHLAVVGIVEVLKNYRFFKRTMNAVAQAIHERKPLAVVGVDYPGFNLRLLERIKQGSPPQNRPRLIQFVSPQLWAWDEKRKWKMAQYLDLVLCIFPFEPAMYKDTGLKAVFVGHPLIDKIPFATENRSSDRIALFPGSRQREIAVHMPLFRKLEKRLRGNGFDVAYACSDDMQRTLVKKYQPSATLSDPASLQARAGAGVVCSGTATLEAALGGLPICVVYRVAWPTYWMGRALIRIPWLAMPNILLKRPLLREFIQKDFTPDNVCTEILRLTQDLSARMEMIKAYRDIRTLLGQGHAPERAADEILSLLGGREPAV